MAGETEQLTKQTDDINTGVGSCCHECRYCKRGFSNAQALGGHMNIHRKEKATKAKRKPPHEDFTIHKYFATISSEQRYRSSNPSYLRAACNRFDLKKAQDNIVRCFDHMMENPIRLPSNSFHLEDHVGEKRKTNNIIMDAAEIDLELRL